MAEVLSFSLQLNRDMPIPVAARSEAIWLLGSQVRIPLGAWMCVSVMSLVFICCVVLCRGLCDGLITRPEECYRASNCMCDHRNPERGPMFQVGNLQENE
jgi:hypothetical protein